MAKAPPGPDFARVAAEVRKRLGSFGDLGGLFALFGFTGFVGVGLYKSVYFVDGGCRAVKFNAITGMKDRTYGEGANFAIPFLETPVIFDIRNKPTEVMTATGSRDLQTVNLAVRVLYQPSVNNLSLDFEVISAFSGCGMSLSLEGSAISFVGSLSVFSKLVVALLILAGRHRTIDMGIDLGFAALQGGAENVFA